jgi:hypothetical protein
VLVNACNRVVEKREEVRTHGRPRPKQRDNIEVDIKKQGVTVRTEMAQNRVQQLALIEHSKETSCFVESGRNVCSNRQTFASPGRLHS